MPVGHKTRFQSQLNEASSDQHHVTCFSLSPIGIDIISLSLPNRCVNPDYILLGDCTKSSAKKYDTSGVASVGIKEQQLSWLRSICFAMQSTGAMHPPLPQHGVE